MPSDPLTDATAGIALVGAVRDECGRILRANEKLARLLAAPIDALVGTEICQYAHPGNRGQVHDAFLRLMADPRAVHESDGRLITANGSVVPVRAIASVITLPGGAAIVLRMLALGE